MQVDEVLGAAGLLDNVREAVATPSLTGHFGGKAGTLYTGERANVRDELFEESSLDCIVTVARQRKADMHGESVVDRDPEIRRTHALIALEKKAGTGEQDDGETHFKDKQGFAQQGTLRAAATGA